MSAPTKKVQKIQTDSSNTYDIVPNMMTDSNGTYKAELDTLYEDDKIELKPFIAEDGVDYEFNNNVMSNFSLRMQGAIAQERDLQLQLPFEYQSQILYTNNIFHIVEKGTLGSTRILVYENKSISAENNVYNCILTIMWSNEGGTLDITGNLYVTPQINDIRINNISTVTDGVGKIITNSAYNASSNKIATMSDITKENAGLGNVTNDKQLKAINSSTNNGLVAFSGTTGDTIKNTGVVISTATVNSNSTDTQIPTAKAVWEAINNLPDPMVFRGSLGEGGTISALPVDGSANVGDTYKVITAGTYAGQSAHVGDTFVCDSKTSNANTWVLLPSGDEPTGTVTSVGISVPTGLTVSNNPITSSGTIEIDYDEGYSIPTTSKQNEWDGKQDALPTYTTGKENYVLSVDANGNLIWKPPYNGAASGS